MRKPRSRRALLTSMVGLSLGAAGCFESDLTSSESEESLESGVVPADEFDCDDVDRPDPSPPIRDEALEPATYPTPPNPLLESAGEYVRDFEAAYQHNAFLEEYGSETEEFEFDLEARDAKPVDAESDREAKLVSLVFDLTTKIRRTPEKSERSIRVTYYVDEHIVLRARYSGLADEPTFDPNPRSAGGPVACFH
ncbi:hypothetical protein [Haloterrigena turkmenica]|nr:hypothetical protein [Haloterrigena turkmenica]